MFGRMKSFFLLHVISNPLGVAVCMSALRRSLSPYPERLSGEKGL